MHSSRVGIQTSSQRSIDPDEIDAQIYTAQLLIAFLNLWVQKKARHPVSAYEFFSHRQGGTERFPTNPSLLQDKSCNQVLDAR